MIYGFFKIEDNGAYQEGMLISIFDLNEQIPGFIINENNYKSFAVVFFNDDKKEFLRSMCQPVYSEDITEDTPVIKFVRKGKVNLADLNPNDLDLVNKLKNPDLVVPAIDGTGLNLETLFKEVV